MKSAYDGDGRFVFFSYAHQDENIVGPFFDALAEKFKVWHDKDIPCGNDSRWDDVILDHIRKSCLFLFCVTPNSLQSEYCKKEVKTAIDNEIAFLSVIIDKLDEKTMPESFKKMYDQFQAYNLFEYASYKEAVKELERRNSAINIALREEYQEKSEKKKKGDFKLTLSNILPRNRYEGIRAIGSFEDFSRVMNTDYSFLDDLEFVTPTLPKEIFEKCLLQQNINSKFMFLLGVCYHLGVGTDVNLKEAVNCYCKTILENVGFPKNMFNKALWNLVEIYRNIMFDEKYYESIDTSAISFITEGDLVKILGYINDFAKHRGPRKDPDEILEMINQSTNLSPNDRKFLLARFHLLIREDIKMAKQYYDEAIQEGSEASLIFELELDNDDIEQMKLRMLRGYSRYYSRYANDLKNEKMFDLTDEEQWNYCLNAARLGNVDAIKDIYYVFYVEKNKNPFDDALMNFLFEQGIEKGGRELIKIQLNWLNSEKGLFKKHAKRAKELAKLDKEYLALANQIKDFLNGIIKDFYAKDKIDNH